MARQRRNFVSPSVLRGTIMAKANRDMAASKRYISTELFSNSTVTNVVTTSVLDYLSGVTVQVTANSSNNGLNPDITTCA